MRRIFAVFFALIFGLQAASAAANSVSNVVPTHYGIVAFDIAATAPNSENCASSGVSATCTTSGSNAKAAMATPTTASLKALPSSVRYVLRLGYYKPGDAPLTAYTASASPCVLHNGQGDDGSQVPSADGKCWIASFTNSAIDPRQFGAKGNGSSDDTAAFEAIAAMPQTALDIVIPPGKWVLSRKIEFVDKNVTLKGSGIFLTQFLLRNSNSGFVFQDTSRSSGWNAHKRLNADSFTIVSDYQSLPKDSLVALDISYSYSGIVASWDHVTLRDIVFQGENSSRYIDTAIRLTDTGCVRMDNIRLDNAGAQAADSTAMVEIRRTHAKGLANFQFSRLYAYGTSNAFLITHAQAPAGTIEGLYCHECELVGVRHVFYDDNESTGDTTRQLNVISYLGGFASYSSSFATLGYATNVDFRPSSTTASNLADRDARLEAGVIIRTYGEGISISNGRWFRDAKAATAPAIVLPPQNQVKSVRIIGNNFAGWSAVVNQLRGNPTTDSGRIVLIGNQHQGMPSSTTNSGAELEPR